MTRYTHPEVAAARDDPEEGATMEVVVVAKEGYTTGVANILETRIPNADIKRKFDTDMLLVEVPETDLDSLCGLEHIESVSPNEAAETLA